jgi:periplasmic mercuric ion binding protein
MKRLITLAVLAAALASPAWAAPRTVTLAVPGMNCPACPFTVKKALERVEGVQQVEVSYKTLEAVVTFDDSKTTIEALTAATGDAGYPSSVKR